MGYGFTGRTGKEKRSKTSEGSSAKLCEDIVINRFRERPLALIGSRLNRRHVKTSNFNAR